MEHHFDVELAKEVGVNASIVARHLAYWIEKNIRNQKHYHDGSYWTYSSVKALAEIFPYFAPKTISTALKKLEDAGYLKTGNYNNSPYDRTKWYAFTAAGLEAVGISNISTPIFPNGKIENQASENQNSRIGEPIPDKEQIEYISKTQRSAAALQAEEVANVIESVDGSDSLKAALRDFAEMRKSMKKPLTLRAMKILIYGKSGLLSIAKTDDERVQIVETSIASGWQAFYPLKSKQRTGAGDNLSGDTGITREMLDAVDYSRFWGE